MRLPQRGKESVTWKHKTGNDGYDDTYATATISNVLVFRVEKLIRRPDSKDVLSTAFFSCAEAVQLDDLITLDGNSRPVVSVSAIPDGSGKAPFRQVYL